MFSSWGGSICVAILCAICVFEQIQAESIVPSRTSAVTAPPRGWNSFPSYTWRINETEFLSNAEAVSKFLLPFGYDTVVIDYLWYQKLFIPTPKRGECGGNLFYLDEYGRPQPDPHRFPSSKDGKGFKEIADKVHAMGLKFGIHVMRGVSQEAVDLNTTILGTSYRTGDPGFAITEYWTGQCFWCPTFMALNQTHPGVQAFYNSLYAQYAEWGVDFIKNDCVFGGWYDTDLDGIFDASEAITNSGRDMVYSLSPGDSTGNTSNAESVHSVVNMYRITNDNWDSWPDVLAHFPVIENFTSLIGASGKNGLSWPDMDIMPFGWISAPGSQIGPFHWTNLTEDEQRTEMTLWSIVKSPLMMGGAANNMDPFTLELLTNTEVLNVQCCSSNNHQFFNLSEFYQIAWAAQGTINGSTPAFYVALFNVGEKPQMNISFEFSTMIASTRTLDILEVPQMMDFTLDSPFGEDQSPVLIPAVTSTASTVSCSVRDLWAHEELGPFQDTITLVVNSHGTRLVAVYDCTSSPGEQLTVSS